MAGFTDGASSNLLECLSNDKMTILFNINGPSIMDHNEQQPMANIKRLVVKQRNTMAAAMAVLRMYQSNDQAVLNFITKLKEAARLYKFEV